MSFVHYLNNHPEIKKGLNKSSMKILKALMENEGPLSTKELVTKCNISTRMIQYNLEKLKSLDPPLVKLLTQIYLKQ